MASKRKITPEDLKNFIGISDANISPDGTRTLFMRSHYDKKNKKQTNLWITDHESKPEQFTSGNKDNHGRWSPDGSKVAFLSNRSEESTQIFLISPKGGEAKVISTLPEGAIGGFKWSPDNRHIAFIFRKTAEEFSRKAVKKREKEELSPAPLVVEEMWYRLDGDGYFNAQRFNLYILDTTTGKHRLVYDKAPYGVGHFSWSRDGKEILMAANLASEPMLEPWKDRLYRVSVKTGKATLLPQQKDGAISLAVWSPDGKKIAYAGCPGKMTGWGSRNEKLFIYNLESASIKCISEKEDYCMGATVIGDLTDAVFGANFIWTPDSKSLLLGLGWHGNMQIAKIMADGGKFEFLNKAEGQFSLTNISNDGKKIPVIHGDSQNPGDLCLGTFDKSGLSLKPITGFNKKLLAGLILSTPEPTWVTTPEGNQVHTWVMKPIDFKAGGKYPAVLEIHGGPHALYGNLFFHEFQVLAANGYAVFFSNPRGSKGYGEDHCHVMAGDWGNKDWIDILAVKEFIEKQKFVDSKRIGVMGGSYGGYMTNWAIGHTNDFAGAITDRCVSNLVSMNGSSDFSTLPDTYWKGNSWDDIETRWNQSPIKYFGKVKTPTLIIHSEGDLRCNIEQADQVYSVLKLRKIPCRYVRYPAATSHGFSRSGPFDLRVHRLKEILNWWKKYLTV